MVVTGPDLSQKIFELIRNWNARRSRRQKSEVRFIDSEASFRYAESPKQAHLTSAKSRVVLMVDHVTFPQTTTEG